MIRITLDADMKRKLGDLDEPVELCDEAGHVIARVIPVVDTSQYDPLTPGISDEELERRSISGEKRYTTAEVLKRLEQI